MGRRRHTPEQVEHAFWGKVDKSGPCWVWLGATTGGRVRYGRFRDTLAHRWSYEHCHGPIPPGREVAHTCHNGLCVRPDHLQALERAENERQKDDAARRPSGVRGLPCPHCGGSQDGRSTRSNGRRFAFCIPCRRAYQRDYMRARRARA